MSTLSLPEREVLWETHVGQGAGPPQWLAAGLTPSRFAALLPPASAGGAGFLDPTARLAGAPLASAAAALDHSRFLPFRDLLAELGAWCANLAASHGDLVAPNVLSLGNAALFRHLTTETFAVCAASRHPDPAGFAATRRTAFQRWVETFLRRLRADRDQFGADCGGRVVALSAHGAESHNGCRRVLRVEFATGKALAYKPRPVHGEVVLTGGDSLFALLQGLPPPVGDIDFPLVAAWPGRGPDGGDYLWQQWIPRSPHWGWLSGDAGPRGTVLPVTAAPWFYKRAGGMAACCFAFGIGDLTEGNLVVGELGGDTRHVPVDLEIFLKPAGRISETGLVPGDGGTHHVGLENRARACGHEGPACYLEASDEAVRLCHTDRGWSRSASDTVVADQRGRTGLRPYLSHFLNGMFQAWALICAHRTEIAEFLDRRIAGAPVRVLHRSTSEYSDALARHQLLGEPFPAHFTTAELEQLSAGDVPYFVVRLGETKVRWLKDDAWVEADVPVPEDGPAEQVLTGKHWDLTSLAAPIRDVVRFAHTDGTTEPAPTSVAFEWPAENRRLVYSWDADTVRLTPHAVDGRAEASTIAERLLRLDRIDASIRAGWTAAGFPDDPDAAILDELTAEAMHWWESVVDVHGWPGEDLIGAEATAAAARLVQHLAAQPSRQARMLKAMRAAAHTGRIPAPHLAYCHDAWCVASERPQLYGTKFLRHGDEFVPYPVDEPDGVDERRAAMGLSPLRDYAERITRTYSRREP